MTLEQRIAEAIRKAVVRSEYPRGEGGSHSHGDLNNRYARERMAHFIANELRDDFLISPGEDDLTQVEALLEKLRKRRRR